MHRTTSVVMGKIGSMGKGLQLVLLQLKHSVSPLTCKTRIPAILTRFKTIKKSLPYFCSSTLAHVTKNFQDGLMDLMRIFFQVYHHNNNTFAI